MTNRVDYDRVTLEEEIRQRQEREHDGMKQGLAFGLCSSCSHFLCAESEFSIVYAKCTMLDKILSCADPVKHCTAYDKLGSMSLATMWAIATLIDPAPRRRAGFLSDDEEEE